MPPKKVIRKNEARPRWRSDLLDIHAKHPEPQPFLNFIPHFIMNTGRDSAPSFFCGRLTPPELYNRNQSFDVHASNPFAINPTTHALSVGQFSDFALIFSKSGSGTAK